MIKVNQINRTEETNDLLENYNINMIELYALRFTVFLSCKHLNLSCTEISVYFSIINVIIFWIKINVLVKC